jgi:hypothetical protein
MVNYFLERIESVFASQLHCLLGLSKHFVWKMVEKSGQLKNILFGK